MGDQLSKYKDFRVNLNNLEHIYREGDSNARDALGKIFGPFIEKACRVRTLEEAIDKLGSHPLVQTRNYLLGLRTDNNIANSIVNYLELRIIRAALNEDKKIERMAYYPTFGVIDEDKAQINNPEWVKARKPIPCGNLKQFFIFEGTDAMTYDYLVGDLYLGYADYETATYAGKEFITYYKRYYLGI